MERLGEALRASYEADRQANPDRYTGSPDGLGRDFLFVENVARMLGCNVDFVRRIPRHELPASTAGRRLIYSRQDVEAFIRSRRDAGVAPMPGGRSRAAGHKSAAEAGETAFDPVSVIKTSLEGKRK